MKKINILHFQIVPPYTPKGSRHEVPQTMYALGDDGNMYWRTEFTQWQMVGYIIPEDTND